MGLRGLIDDVRTDLVRLLAVWRAVRFPGQLDPHPVQGTWRPTTPRERAGFWLWTAAGVALFVVLYPLAVAGFGARYVARRVDRAVATLGLLVVLAVVGVVWGGLTLLAWERFPASGFRAVLAASLVATASAGLGYVFTRVGGRAVTVLVASPFVVAAVVLPPVTAAVFSPTLGSVVLPGSTSLAVWLLDNVLVVADLNAYLRREFRLAGLAFVGMWFGLSVPVGWGLGSLVALANLVRPREDD